MMRRAVDRGEWPARAGIAALIILAAQASVARVATGQTTREAPWTVELTTSPVTLAIGSCSSVYLTLKDAETKDVPRDGKGVRISMADFDMRASGAAENTVVGNYHGAASYSVCACQGASVGGQAAVRATYPAASLATRGGAVKGVAFESAIEVPIVAALGKSEPQGCSASKTTTVSAGSGSTGAPTPTALIAAPAMTTAVPLLQVAPSNIPPIGSGAIERPYVGITSHAEALLIVNGASSAVAHVSGGGVVSNVKAGSAAASVRVEPFVIEFRPGNPIEGWINATWSGTAGPASGMLIPDPAMTRLGALRLGRLAFGGATIVSVRVPTLDWASKDVGQLQAVFTASTSGSPTVAPSDAAVHQAVADRTPNSKRWLANSFRLQVGNLESVGVRRIESFTVGLEQRTSESGERQLVPGPNSSPFPNLLVTMEASKAAGWMAWYDAVVLHGNGGAAQEKTLTLDFLSPDLKTTIGTLKAYGVGIVALRSSQAVSHGETFPALQAELYVTRMEFSTPALPGVP